MIERPKNKKPRHCNGEAQLLNQWNPKESFYYCIAVIGFAKEAAL
jgi:hypothetical protein